MEVRHSSGTLQRESMLRSHTLYGNPCLRGCQHLEDLLIAACHFGRSGGLRCAADLSLHCYERLRNATGYLEPRRQHLRALLTCSFPQLQVPKEIRKRSPAGKHCDIGVLHVNSEDKSPHHSDNSHRDAARGLHAKTAVCCSHDSTRCSTFLAVALLRCNSRLAPLLGSSAKQRSCLSAVDLSLGSHR